MKKLHDVKSTRFHVSILLLCLGLATLVGLRISGAVSMTAGPVGYSYRDSVQEGRRLQGFYDPPQRPSLLNNASTFVVTQVYNKTDLRQAILDGTRHILIKRHLDLTRERTGFVSEWAVPAIPDAVWTIRVRFSHCIEAAFCCHSSMPLCSSFVRELLEAERGRPAL
jgi:hypothetical protein